MIFDKNQKEFPSVFHRDVWWWGVGIVPIEESLTLAVVEKCGADAAAGCRQWRDYFIELAEDMYRHADEYLPASPRQYRDILENIAAGGAISNNEIIWQALEWDNYCIAKDKSKAYKTVGAETERCVRALGRIGLTVGRRDGEAVFANVKYPKIFHAMRVMEFSPNVRKTPVRHHFAHCEFRQLVKSYSADYNGLLRRVGDESLAVAHAIHDYASKANVQRYIHFDIIKYKYKNVRVLDFSIRGDEYPTLRVNIETGGEKTGVNAFMSDMPKIIELIDNRIRSIEKQNALHRF